MRYLIYFDGNAFYTNWYDYENNYTDGLIVFDLETDKFTSNGKDWEEIEEDHL